MKVFQTADIYKKIEYLKSDIEACFIDSPLKISTTARDVPVLPVNLHPNKKGLSYKEGQARLLHDLASIELQAMELALRTLAEYPDAPSVFREELAALTLSESQHLTLCLNGIEDLGFHWGDWPVHMVLWEAVSSDDSLLDRLLIVHRYLEGSGLDAGDAILNRLKSVEAPTATTIVQQIVTEEVDHVLFGSRWYKEICRIEKREEQTDFIERLQKLNHVLPRRLEKINHPLRAKSGFTDVEIQGLEDLRDWQLRRVYTKTLGAIGQK